MKKLKYSILLFAALLMCQTTAQAQLDSRNRNAETVISDGLTEMPAQNSKDFNKLMQEFAGTGTAGTKMLIDKLVPAANGKNAQVEYALNGLVDYVMAGGRSSEATKNVRQGLIEGLESCSDNANKAFIMTQLQKCATKDQLNVFDKYLNDTYLHGYAVRGIAATPGSEELIKNLVAKGEGNKGDLAYLVFFKRIKDADVESQLLKWAGSTSDSKILGNINEALAICGGEKSVAVLEKACKALNFQNDPANTVDAYLQLLGNIQNAKMVAAKAKALLQATNPAMRCAGLALLLENSGSKAAKEVLDALKDGNKQYRNTALQLAKETAGKGICDEIAKKFNSFKNDDAKVDIVRWFGNNHCSCQLPLVCSQMGSNNKELAEAAILAASKTGGENALAALMAQLDGANADYASKALLSFNGSIKVGVEKALQSTNNSTLVQALKLASARKMTSSFNRVYELTNSSESTVKNAALDALTGVSTIANFDQICDKLDKASGTDVEKLQEAAKAALATQKSGDPYATIAARLGKASKPALYYPLLSQEGSDASVNKLLEAYKNGADKDAAYKALLKTDNNKMIDNLYAIAKNGEGNKDELLDCYLNLVKKCDKSNEAKYLLYRQALELNPSDKVKNNLLKALGSTQNLQALNTVMEYLGNDGTSFAAANAAKTLVTKNADLQKSTIARHALEKAKAIFQVKKDAGNADAGYSVDEITDFMPKLAADGYKREIEKDRATKENILSDKKNYENFELRFDSKADGNSVGELYLHSLPQLKLTQNGAQAYDGAATTDAKNYGSTEWHNIYVKVVDNRMEAYSDGVLVFKGDMKNYLSAKQKVPEAGNICLMAKEGGVDVRDVFVNTLPKTPVYQLTNEEKKAGFEVLFDGRNLDKWHGNKTSYVPEDGAIYVTAKYGGSGNLYTNKKYSDFIYRFEFCFATPGVNNGVGVRTHEGADAAYDGMEIQVLDHDDPIYKGLQQYQQHGAVYGIIVPKHVKFGKLGTWNVEEIQAVGDNIKVTVNGEVILEGNIREACQGHNVAPEGAKTNPYTVDHKNHPGLFNKEGYVSFCGHGPGVKFRNVRILDLSKKTVEPTRKHKK